MSGTKEGVKRIFGYPTATVIHSRVPIFQASRRVRGVTCWSCQTSWGSVEVSGRLGQGHRDLHDLIMTQGEEYHLGELGDLHIVVDPAKIQRFMGTRSNPRLLARLLEDLRQARVSLAKKDGKSSLGGIVSVVDKQSREIEGPGGFMEKMADFTILTPQFHHVDPPVTPVKKIPPNEFQGGSVCPPLNRFFR